jgi:hypothetical protein
MQLLNTGRYHARGSNVLLSVAQLKGPAWYFSLAHTRTSAGDSYFVDQAVRAAQQLGGVPPDPAVREMIFAATALHDALVAWRHQHEHRETDTERTECNNDCPVQSCSRQKSLPDESDRRPRTKTSMTPRSTSSDMKPIPGVSDLCGDPETTIHRGLRRQPGQAVRPAGAQRTI